MNNRPGELQQVSQHHEGVGLLSMLAGPKAISSPWAPMEAQLLFNAVQYRPLQQKNDHDWKKHSNKLYIFVQHDLFEGWSSRGSTFRSHLRPRGNKRRSKAVRMANRMVRRICYLKLGCMLDATYSVCGSLFVTNVIPRIEYARKKDCFWTIEQPQSSLLPYHRPFEACVFPFPVSQRIPPSNRSIHE